MTAMRVALVRLAAAAAVAARLPTPAAAQDLIWRGRSGGFDIAWSGHEISARRASDGAIVFSARSIFDREVRDLTDHADTTVPVREYERDLRILSVVGPVISLEDVEYCDCGGAHPISWTRFVAYDLARSTVARPFEVPAADLVGERELVRALTADRLIARAMDAAHAHAFASLRGLAASLKGHEIEYPDDCTYAVGESFPTEWAAHHLENGRVALRFSLSHAVEVCRGRYVQVGVLATPLPRSLPDFQAADARRAGFLMKAARAIAGQRQSVLHWRARGR